MGMNRQSHPDEKDLRRITALPLAFLILKVLREAADKNGRVLCEPTFIEFLETKLLSQGYTKQPGWSLSDRYNQAMGILYAKRLARRISGKNGHTSAVFYIDLSTTYEQAQMIDLKLREFLCSDLIAVLDSSTTAEAILEVRSESIKLARVEANQQLIHEQVVTISQQTAEIEYLRALVTDTLQEADKFAKETRKRLKQA
jgi:hypothetical protein